MGIKPNCSYEKLPGKNLLMQKNTLHIVVLENISRLPVEALREPNAGGRTSVTQRQIFC